MSAISDEITSCHFIFPWIVAISSALFLLSAPAIATPDRVVIGLARGEALHLVGAWDPIAGWLQSDSVVKDFRAGQSFAILDLSGRRRDITLRTNEYEEVTSDWWGRMSRSIGTRENRIALAGIPADVTNRPVRVQSNTLPVYRRAVADALRDSGIRSEAARVAQSLRVDLDGDGTDEVLLQARSRANIGNLPVIKPGDYSAVILRFLRDGAIATVPLALEAWPRGEEFAAPASFEIIAITDINGDGRMEIILHGQYYEGDFVEIYSFDGRHIIKVLENGWGV